MHRLVPRVPRPASRSGGPGSQRASPVGLNPRACPARVQGTSRGSRGPWHWRGLGPPHTGLAVGPLDSWPRDAGAWGPTEDVTGPPTVALTSSLVTCARLRGVRLCHTCAPAVGAGRDAAASAPRPLAAPASDGETVAAQSRERFRGPPTPSRPCLGASAHWSPAGSRTADLTLHLHRRLSMSGVPTAPQQQGHSLCHRRGKGTWDRARMAPRTPTSGVQGIGLRLWGAGRTSGRAEPRDWPQRPARLTRWPGGAGSGPSASGSCPRPPPRFSPLAEPPRPSVLGGAEMHTRLPLWGAAQEGPRGPAPSPARSRRRWPCA